MPPKTLIADCSVSGCLYHGQLKRSFCPKHYQAWWKDHKYEPRACITPMGKICRLCKRDKPLSEYVKAKSSPDGHHARCRECTAKYQTQWRKKNPDKGKEYGKRWRDRNPDYEQNERYRSPEYKRGDYERRGWNYNLVTKYGITADEFYSMLESQGGGCAICGRKDSGVAGRQMHTDHCHKTGKVRGVLCHHCNRGIGGLQDDPDLLRAALAYLLKHSDDSS